MCLVSRAVSELNLVGIEKENADIFKVRSGTFDLTILNIFCLTFFWGLRICGRLQHTFYKFWCPWIMQGGNNPRWLLHPTLEQTFNSANTVKRAQEQFNSKRPQISLSLWQQESADTKPKFQKWTIRSWLMFAVRVIGHYWNLEWTPKEGNTWFSCCEMILQSCKNNEIHLFSKTSLQFMR